MTVLSSLPATTTAAPLVSGVAVAKPAAGVSTAAAVALASDADVVSLLGGGNGAGATYNAAGLFNSIANAGAAVTPASSVAAAAEAAAQAAASGSTAGATTATTSSSALATTSTSPATGSVDQNANYANILKATPSAASALVADSFNQGIVSTISTYA